MNLNKKYLENFQLMLLMNLLLNFQLLIFLNDLFLKMILHLNQLNYNNENLMYLYLNLQMFYLQHVNLVNNILIQLFDNEYLVKNVEHMNDQYILMLYMIFHLI